MSAFTKLQTLRDVEKYGLEYDVTCDENMQLSTETYCNGKRIMTTTLDISAVYEVFESRMQARFNLKPAGRKVRPLAGG